MTNTTRTQERSAARRRRQAASTIVVGALLLLASSSTTTTEAFSVVPPSYRNSIQRSPAAFAPSAPLSATATDASDSASVGAGADADAPQQQHEIWLLEEVDSIFKALDKDGDGEITQDELERHMVDEMGYTKAYTNFLFESIDTDSNGSISRDELGFAFYNFEALSLYATLGLGGADLTQRPGFQKLLKTQSEGTTRDRLLLDDLADLVFELIDADGSGEITKDELRDHFGSVTKRLAEQSNGRAATVQQSNEYVTTMFETLDANKDGTICRDEVRAAFEKYDFKLLARTFGLRVYSSA